MAQKNPSTKQQPSGKRIAGANYAVTAVASEGERIHTQSGLRVQVA
ncbi:MAG: hypothetical protein KAJ11_01130 [Alphaproteobacteria bacterium]|jgi:hypothetical protein|nr:hypothetical protein [Alphaproteobacteria bacterium]MCK5620862.1 hypothetical protein [Alphaproteobacteria bacterium]